MLPPGGRGHPDKTPKFSFDPPKILYFTQKKFLFSREITFSHKKGNLASKTIILFIFTQKNCDFSPIFIRFFTLFRPKNYNFSSTFMLFYSFRPQKLHFFLNYFSFLFPQIVSFLPQNGPFLPKKSFPSPKRLFPFKNGLFSPQIFSFFSKKCPFSLKNAGFFPECPFCPK